MMQVANRDEDTSNASSHLSAPRFDVNGRSIWVTDAYIIAESAYLAPFSNRRPVAVCTVHHHTFTLRKPDLA